MFLNGRLFYEKGGLLMNIVEPIRKKHDIEVLEIFLKERSLRDLLLFVLGTNSGLRISDILALNVRDVKNKTHITIREKKTGKFKKFPINSKLKSIIFEYTKNKTNNEALFKTKFNNRLERVGAYMILKNASQKAGIEENIGTHTLRKTFGYHHYKQFKDIAILQKIFNHSNPEVTLRYIGIEQSQIEESYSNFIL